MRNANDLIFIRSALPEFIAFLTSEEIYWPLPSTVIDSAGVSQSRYSLGLVLLGLNRLTSEANSSEDIIETEKISREVWGVKSRFIVAWERKATREFQNRLRTWQALLDELLPERVPSNAIFNSNVRTRVILHLLSQEIPQQSAHHQQLAILDERLISSWVPGNFNWDRMLQPMYPQHEFWYLYGELKGKNPERR